MLVSSMATVQEISSNFPIVKGASLEYICGVLSSAKAVVFNGNGQRLIETEEIRTTDARYNTNFPLFWKKENLMI